MIITRIIGGLGNQMFQYAAGLSLAKKLGTSLRYDARAFKDYELHKFGLHNFQISAHSLNLLDRAAVKYAGNYSIFKEEGFDFSPQFFGQNKNTMLDGYWQSEKYFKDIREAVLSEFAVKHQPTIENQRLIEKIRSTGAVSLHVRRGDYVSSAEFNNIHGTCDVEYYKRCISLIMEKVERPTFFIFSDEPDWAKENIPVEGEKYVSYNSADLNYEDLRLMSLCQHHIIANSSFSWWGAWLAQNKDQIVCAPRQWFKDTSRNSKDIVPESWLKM